MDKFKKRKILVTAALPYANGDIHLGHLVEYLQTDFWVRFQKMRGHECLYMCADDTHGTPIMISAREQGMTPEALIEASRKKHIDDFTAFEIAFDNYYSTNSPEDREFTEHIYKHMVKKGHIDFRRIKQLYCEHDKMFLPDRFVIGVCPKCGAADQYGDSCDKCGAAYSTAELKEPKCAVCASPPVEKESEHLFFKLNELRGFLKPWVKTHTSPDVCNKLEEWLKDDLRDWDISRDAPYFGFEIPGKPGKYFYVWVDAPVGYMASTQNWCARNNRQWEEFWKDTGDNELYHFIGKDIVYFHTLFWPAMLHVGEFKTPDAVFVHGFLTVNGQKMSKSKGTFIKARTYLDHLDPMYLRYYYASKLNSTTDDIDLSFEDFVLRLNSELIGKITNLASRGAQMLNTLDGRIAPLSTEGSALIKAAQSKGDRIAKFYEDRDFARGLVEIREIADTANKYFDDKEPWKLIKTDIGATKEVLAAIINMFRVIAIYLKPILPSYVKKVEKLFQEPPYQWDDAEKILTDVKIGKFEHLAQRVDKKNVEAIVLASQATLSTPAKDAPLPYAPLEKEITIDDFTKIDLRVAKVLEAEEIKDAAKLLRLKIDLGFETRQLIGGLKKAYTPKDLVGRNIIVVANLKPRRMKFGTSEGMLLAAGPGDQDIFILSPDDGAKPGDRVG